MKWVVSSYSRSQVDAAGRTLSALLTSEEDLDRAYSVLDNWRAAHSFPLNTIQMGLRSKARSVDPRSLVAQRLKRVPSIMFKLKRFPQMRLSQMQDIGGCRAVVSSVQRAYDLRDLYAKSRASHVLRAEKDYISDPQSTGYRGIHLVYTFLAPKSPEFSGLSIEIQLRSRWQHAWATAVETVGILSRQSLKSNLGEAQWLRFFAQASAVFAEEERSAPVPGVLLSGRPLRRKVFDQLRNDRLGERLKNIGRALTVARARADSSAVYFLLALNPSGDALQVTGYRRDELSRATTDYLLKEREYASIKGAEAVLVSTTSIQALERAYPNYFLDTGVFVRRLERLCES
jgi:ppGpp synthetase/RelA/SpoT-type nucleotidyltranferase